MDRTSNDTGHKSFSLKHKISDITRLLFIRSPLAWRLLAVNLLAPFLLVVGLFYMDHYQQGLIEAEIKLLKGQAELISIAVSEGGVSHEFTASMLPFEREREVQQGFYQKDTGKKTQNTSSLGRTGDLLTRTPREIFRLIPSASRHIIQRLSSIDKVRVRLFDHNGVLTADSRVTAQSFTSRPTSFWSANLFETLFKKENLPRYEEPQNQTAFDYEEVGVALGDGVFAYEVRYKEGYGKILSVAIPVIYSDQVVGAIMLNGGIDNVIDNLIAFRLAVFRLFAVAFTVTILLSFYMVRTILTPLNRLSSAAVNIRVGGGRRQIIPDETKRKDEIGDLSSALIKMTDALWQRLDATERFAADVAHEIKNPLSSMRSAIETINHISSEEKKQRLMAIIHEDILRLDRLITDISNLSRLDAELSREEFEPILIHRLLSSLVEVYSLGEISLNRKISFKLVWNSDLAVSIRVLGMETRLAQVFYNLIGNAISFSPDGGAITVFASKNNDKIELRFEDEGSGIPKGQEEKLFQRFYCERPTTEKFGHHSGLGLAISEKIISGLNGQIYAKNRLSPIGKVLGACFVVILPIKSED